MSEQHDHQLLTHKEQVKQTITKYLHLIFFIIAAALVLAASAGYRFIDVSSGISLASDTLIGIIFFAIAAASGVALILMSDKRISPTNYHYAKRILMVNAMLMLFSILTMNQVDIVQLLSV